MYSMLYIFAMVVYDKGLTRHFNGENTGSYLHTVNKILDFMDYHLSLSAMDAEYSKNHGVMMNSE